MAAAFAFPKACDERGGGLFCQSPLRLATSSRPVSQLQMQPLFYPEVPTDAAMMPVVSSNMDPSIIYEAPSPEFAPVLNVPALCSFLIIMTIFSFLQHRVVMIGQAVDVHTAALDELRELKARQLSGEVSAEEVNQGLVAYKEAFEKVERLRFIVPGLVRISPPPSGIMEKNQAAAAKQFLGIEDKFVSSTTEKSESNNRGLNSKRTTMEEEGLSPALTSILAIVAASQIFLLGLLVLDPLSVNDVLNSVGSGLE